MKYSDNLENNANSRHFLLQSANNPNKNSQSMSRSAYMRASSCKDKLFLKQNKQIEQNLNKIHHQEIRKTFLRMGKANDIGLKMTPNVHFKALNIEEGPISFEMYIDNVLSKRLGVAEFENEWSK